LRETHGKIAPESVNNALMTRAKFAASHDFFSLAASVAVVPGGR
jgi:hypothetical protein